MMHYVLLLALNDLAVAFRNKSIFMLVFVPILICLLLGMIDAPGSASHPAHIGMISGEPYPEGVILALPAMRKIMEVDWIDSADIGAVRLKQSTLDGVLLRSAKHPFGVELLVNRKHALSTLAIIENIAAIQRTRDGQDNSWIKGVSSIRQEKMQTETLPTWVLMNMLLVGLLIVPAQVASEKEGRQLLGLLQAPIRESEWLGGKLVMGLALSMFSVLLLHIFCDQGVERLLSYVTVLSIGSMYFCSVGILLGCLCGSQASARALGLSVYIPHLLPPALAEFSQKFAVVSSFIPSFQFFRPIKAILFDDLAAMSFINEMFYLISAASISLFASRMLLKRRWLM